jgi:L-arabinose isomerase
MARLIDQGIVVTSEGDLATAVAGLIIKDITGKPIHFWEHLAFDEEGNWILGGHEGGSAGFGMAKDGTRPRLRGTQYIDFDGIPGAPHYGVLPEFITNPGPVTLLTFFRGPEAYEMRIARGESVDLDPFPVCYEHTVFKPCLPLEEYFARIAETGVCHHFALVHADIGNELEKVAHILGMKTEVLTDHC